MVDLDIFNYPIFFNLIGWILKYIYYVGRVATISSLYVLFVFIFYHYCHNFSLMIPRTILLHFFCSTFKHETISITVSKMPFNNISISNFCSDFEIKFYIYLCAVNHICQCWFVCFDFLCFAFVDIILLVISTCNINNSLIITY